MTSPDARFERLLDQIYDAATDEQLWSDTLHGIARFVGAVGGLAVGFSWSTYQALNHYCHNGGLDEDYTRLVIEQHMDNPWARAMERQPEMKLVNSDDVVPLSLLRHTEFYNQCLRPHGLAHSTLSKLIQQQDMTLAFGTSQSKPYKKEQLLLLERLLPDIRRAFMLNLRFEGYKALFDAKQQALDQLSEGVALLDRSGRVLFANRAALACPGLLLAHSGGHLCALAPGQQSQLESAMQSVADGAASASLPLPVPGRPKPLNLLIMRARESALDHLIEHRLGNVALMLFVRDPERAPQTLTRQLADAYGLTPAECRVALKAAEGLDTAGLAETLVPNRPSVDRSCEEFACGMMPSAHIAPQVNCLCNQ
ncbi:MAG: PAS domain-containing protein [Rhodanobacter sp.]|jgi:PAS domain-containing protein|nr:PAS domain-containing protein [Rhodanobacter sp.]